MIPKYRSLFAAGALAAGSIPVSGQTTATPLEPVVVTANRLPESPADVGSDFFAVTGADLDRAQLFTLADALSGVPGAPIFATGQAGAAASIFLRGANSDQTLFLVDGIRLNDANTDYGPFLNGARLFRGDQVEEVLGPQSTLYGGGAAGGVVSVTTQRGSGRPQAALSAETGSFGTHEGDLTAEGAVGSWGYNLAASTGQTDNDRINNRFASDNFRLRWDWDVAPTATVGATLRGFIARYGDPSDEYTNDPLSYETEDNWLGTVFAEVRPAPAFTTHLTVGGQYRDYDAYSFFDGVAEAPTLERNRREVIDWQNTARLPGHNRLAAGLTAESDSTFDNGFGDIDQRERLLAFYAEDEWAVADPLRLTGGLRSDDYSTFGRAETGRLTAAWLLAGRTLKLRATYGTGFNPPSFLDLYGISPGSYVGNPNLRPERTRGWDAGADYYLPGRAGVLSVTGFEDDFENLITYDFNVFPGTTENVGRARTRGFELAGSTPVFSWLQAKLAYTRLEAEDLIAQQPLARRPHDTANLDLWSDLGHGFSLGAGATWVGIRPDVDAQTFATVNDPPYSTARFYAAWQATAHLRVKLRVENAFDRYYEPVNGYPALPRGVFASADWRF